MKLPLFEDDTESINELGTVIEKECFEFARGLVSKYPDVSFRDLQVVIEDAICFMLLHKRVLYKQELGKAKLEKFLTNPQSGYHP